MQTNILEYLENSAVQYADKTAYRFGDIDITFSEAREKAMAFSKLVSEKIERNKPVVIIMEKSIDIVIELELWKEGKAYDRLGMGENTINILDVNVPHILMPVRPGRNMAIVIEVAARNFRLKKMGYDAAQEFNKRWMSQMNGQE